MTIYDFSIAAESYDLPIAKKEGDIINYLDHPSEWGNKPLRNCLIVPIDNIPDDILSYITCPIFDDGTYKKLEMDNQNDLPWVSGMERMTGSIITEQGYLFIAQNNGISSNDYPNFNLTLESDTTDNDIIWKCTSELLYKFWRPNIQFNAQDKILVNEWVYEANQAGLTGNDIPTFQKSKGSVIVDNEVSWTCLGNTNPNVLAIKRFRISLEDIKNNFYTDLDLNRVRDINDPYQPLKDNNIILDYVGGTSFIFDKFLNTYI